MILSNKNLLHSRLPTIVASAVALGCNLALAGNPGDSLARNVPAQVGLFAEVRGGGDLLTRLTDPQIWTTLAELAGQPARPEDVAIWRQRIEQTVKMKPEVAIKVLFSKAVAFVGEGPGRAQDAVVLCRPNHGVTTADLLNRWKAQRQEEPHNPPTYRLYSNIGVSEHDGLLLFGDTIPKDGLFAQMQRFTAQGNAASLANDPVYRKLLARVPSDPEGVLFARLEQAAPLLVPNISTSSQTSSQPGVTPVLPRCPGRCATPKTSCLHCIARASCYISRRSEMPNRTRRLQNVGRLA